MLGIVLFQNIITTARWAILLLHSSLDDLDFWGDEGFGEQGREVGHDLFERLLFRRVEHNIGKAHQFIEIDTRLTIQFR